MTSLQDLEKEEDSNSISDSSINQIPEEDSYDLDSSNDDENDNDEEGTAPKKTAGSSS